MNEEEIDKLELILQGCKDYPDAELTEWERNFIADTDERYEKYGARTRISEKQWEVLDRIYGKLPI